MSNTKSVGTSSVDEIFQKVREEMDRQVSLWGDQSWPDTHRRKTSWQADLVNARIQHEQNVEDARITWEGIVWEEFCEALAEDDPEKIEMELTQLAACVCSWIRDVRRRK
jgi:hypothetical protein